MNREYRLENFYHGAENLKTLVILQRYIDNPAGDVVFLLAPPQAAARPIFCMELFTKCVPAQI